MFPRQPKRILDIGLDPEIIISGDLTAVFKHLQRQRAWSVVLVSELLERRHGLCITVVGHQELWRFFQAHDEDTEKSNDKYKCSVDVVCVSPAVVDVGGTVVSRQTRVLRKKCPCKENCKRLADTPEKSKKRQEPLVFVGKVLQENTGIQHQIAASRKTGEDDEEVVGGERAHCTSQDGKHGGEKKRQIEGQFSTDDVGSKTPENGSQEHSKVEALGRHWVGVAKLVIDKRSDTTFDKGKLRIGCIPHSTETKKLEVVRGEPDLVDGVVDELDLLVESSITGIEALHVQRCHIGVFRDLRVRRCYFCFCHSQCLKCGKEDTRYLGVSRKSNHGAVAFHYQLIVDSIAALG